MAGLFLSDSKLTKLTRIDPQLDDARMPSVNPDGKRIAFVRRGHVWVINLDGSGLKQLTVTGEAEAWPTWSPDGRSLAVAGKGEHHIVMLVPPGSQTPVELRNAEDATMQAHGRITWR